MIFLVVLCTYVRSIYPPVLSCYRKQRFSEPTCFRTSKINGNENSEVFDRRTKPFRQIVLL